VTTASIAPGDRVRFDGKRTSWLARAGTPDGRYLLLTASFFGEVAYTIIDWERDVRGAMYVLGGGLGIETLRGPDPRIDEAISMLRPSLLAGESPVGAEDDDGLRGFEVSWRNFVPLRITSVRPAAEVAS